MDLRRRINSGKDWIIMLGSLPALRGGLHARGVLRQRWPTPVLDTQCNEETLAKCNLQLQSPLFGTLPPELRNMIFELATQPYDDPDPRFQYANTDRYYRPGYAARHKHHTALLLSCRRAWLEANSLPLRNAQLTFWFRDDNRRPPWTRTDDTLSVQRARSSARLAQGQNEEQRYEKLMVGLTQLNKQNLQRVRIFAQMYFLERRDLQRMLERAYNAGAVVPPIVTVTIRYTDWWWWENNEALRMEDSWIGCLLKSRQFDAVQAFRLELEILTRDQKQLQAIIAQITKAHKCTDKFQLEEEDVPILTWRGPSLHRPRIARRSPRAHPSSEVIVDSEYEYEIHTLVWGRKPS